MFEIQTAPAQCSTASSGGGESPPRPDKPSGRRARFALLLPAFALLFGAFSLFIPVTAQAQGGTIWSATLTPVASGLDTGCSNHSFNADARCDKATVLSDDDFSYGGKTYTIIQLFDAGGQVNIELDDLRGRDTKTMDLFSSLGAMLHIGPWTFAASDAIQSGYGDSRIYWSNDSFRLHPRTPVAVRLVAIAPTNLTVAQSGVRVTARWTGPTRDSFPAGTIMRGYQVQYRPVVCKQSRPSLTIRDGVQITEDTRCTDAHWTSHAGWSGPHDPIALQTTRVIDGLKSGAAYDVRVRTVYRLYEANSDTLTDWVCARSSGGDCVDDSATGQQVVGQGGATTTPDATVTLSATPNPVDEGSPVTVRVALDQALSYGLEVLLTVTDGTAEAGDRGSLSGIRIDPGFLSNTGTITTNHDADTDDETFTVAIDPASLGAEVAAGTPSSIVVTIEDDDASRQQGGATGTDPVPVTRSPHASLIADVKEWRNDSRYVSDKAHTDRWDRVLLALGETVSDSSLTPMTAAEAQGYADRGWTRWVEVAQTLQALESGTADPQPVDQDPPGQLHATFIADAWDARDDPVKSLHPAHVERWNRVLLALGEPVPDTSLTPMTATEAQGYADRGWTPWNGVVTALNAVVTGTGSGENLTGTANGELLVGLGGSDTLSGLGGDDELRAGDGNDTLTGGEGRDRFVFFLSDAGAKTISDFASGDVIVLKGSGWSSAPNVIATVEAVGTGGYRYTLASGLTVETTNNRSLRTEDFVLEDD